MYYYSVRSHFTNRHEWHYLISSQGIHFGIILTILLSAVLGALTFYVLLKQVSIQKTLLRLQEEGARQENQIAGWISAENLQLSPTRNELGHVVNACFRNTSSLPIYDLHARVTYFQKVKASSVSSFYKLNIRTLPPSVTRECKLDEMYINSGFEEVFEHLKTIRRNLDRMHEVENLFSLEFVFRTTDNNYWKRDESSLLRKITKAEYDAFTQMDDISRIVVTASAEIAAELTASAEVKHAKPESSK